MKIINLLNPKVRINFVLLSLFLCSFFSLTSQAQNVWKGGTPGQESEWNNPKNWSKNNVPDWTDVQIIVPDVSGASGFFPEIKSEVEPIPHLDVQSGASVSILAEGILVIDGESTFNNGIYLRGLISNKGKLQILNTAMLPVDGDLQHINNDGYLAFDSEEQPTGKLVKN